MKTEDSGLERIRQVRHEISEEFDHDPRKLVAHYLDYQEQFADRLLREPRKARSQKSSTLGTGGTA